MSDRSRPLSAVDPRRISCETLERLGELRRDRLNNPKYMYWAIPINAFLVGTLGILSGYALYFQVEPIVHLRRGALLMVMGITIAVMLGFISEWIRHFIEEGARHLPSLPSVLTTLLTLFLFEIFVVSIHNVSPYLVDPNAADPDIVRALHDIGWDSVPDFLTVALVWIFSGVALTAALSWAVFMQRRSIWVGVVYGGVIGGICAAVGVFFWMLISRASHSILLTRQQWRAILDEHQLASILGRTLDHLIDARPLGLPVTIIVLLFVTAWVSYRSWKVKNLKAIFALVIVAPIVLGLAVMDDNLILLPLCVGVAWCIPGALLGIMVPWLLTREKLPHYFGILLLLLGLALPLIGPFLLHFPVPIMLIVAAVILISSGFLIMKDREVKAYWPLLTLSIAIITCAITFLPWNPANLQSLPVLGVSASSTAAKTGEAGPKQTQGAGTESKGEQENDLFLSAVCIIGSFAFWVSAGLLVSWSIRETHERTSLGLDGKERCFWVQDSSRASRDYHDLQHGILPKNDHDLFTRLALELLTRGSPWKEIDANTQVFEDFNPARVAQMNAIEVRKQLRNATARGKLKSPSIYTVESVIDNAKRVLAFCNNGVEPMLMRALQAEAAIGPERAVRFFRSTFKVRRNFAVGSFLQATGVLPGAHFRGCWRYSGDLTPD